MKDEFEIPTAAPPLPDWADEPDTIAKRRRDRKTALAASKFVKAPLSRLVYVVKAENGLLKIGSAFDVALRMRELRSMSPVPLELIYFVHHASVAFERGLHRKLRPYRSHGEWFRVELDIVKAAIVEMCDAARKEQGRGRRR